MMDYLAKISILSQFLDDYKLLERIDNASYFYDEPRPYYFSAKIRTKSSYFTQGGYFTPQALYGGGNSFFDKHVAMFKCLAETIERLAQESFKVDNILYSTFENIRQAAIDPALNLPSKQVRTETIGWTIGRDLIYNKKYLIPAQYAHYMFLSYRNERRLTELISTGGSIGFSHEDTLLRCIYEVVERDAFMTAYLIKAPCRKIDVGSISNPQINYMKEQLSRYRLEWHVIDVTNDLSIPTFISIVIDRTRLGPAITAGASCGFDTEENIVKSLSEAVMSRPWIRASLLEKNAIEHIASAETKIIRDRLTRAVFWFPTSRIKSLDFWLQNKKVYSLPKSRKFNSKKQELLYVTQCVSKKNYGLYYVDITHREMKKYGIHVYKAISPQLHSLFLDEVRPFINNERLKKVATYFGMKRYMINTISHPFL